MLSLMYFFREAPESMMMLFLTDVYGCLLYHGNINVFALFHDGLTYASIQFPIVKGINFLAFSP